MFYLLALGPVDPKLSPFAHGHRQAFSHAGTDTGPQTPALHTYHVVRNHYHSTQLREYLLKDEYVEPFRV